MSTLKVGDKVQLLQDVEGFNKGQIVEVFELYGAGCHLFKGANTQFKHCDGQEGAWLLPVFYKVLPSTPAHPHANLMLKYAMIAQYDDKPWECFEFLNSHDQWVPFMMDIDWSSKRRYRLKPQPPVVQVGQTWVSLSNGQEVQVFRKPYPSEGGYSVVKDWVVGIVLDEQLNLVTTVVISELDLISHFKRKE